MYVNHPQHNLNDICGLISYVIVNWMLFATHISVVILKTTMLIELFWGKQVILSKEDKCLPNLQAGTTSQYISCPCFIHVWHSWHTSAYGSSQPCSIELSDEAECVYRTDCSMDWLTASAKIATKDQSSQQARAQMLSV